MNKIASMLSVMALSMGFVACENYDLPNPPAQSNPADAIFKAENLTIAPISVEGEAAKVIDLKALNDANEPAAVAAVEVVDWPADYQLGMTMYVSKTEDMANAQPCSLTVKDGIAYAAADELQGAVAAVTADPREANFFTNFAATADLVDAEGKVLGSVNIGSPEYRYAGFPLAIKPFPADYVIEDNYFLVNGDNRIKLTHSSASPYDDPMFTTIVEITADQAAAGYEWTVVPESGKPVMGGEGESGNLAEGTTGKVSLSGPVMFSFDMKAKTFNISNAYEFLYTPGNSNGWAQDASQVLFTTDYVNYNGFAYLSGEFKFDATLDWGAPFGNSGVEGKLSTDPGAGNLVADPEGLYWCTANIVELTYAITPIQSVSVIGDGTPGGWDADTELTRDPNNFLIWSGEVDFTAGEFKFRMNNGWDINLGGELGNLQPGAGNMAATPGKHKVTLNLTTYPYTCTIE